MGAMNCNRCDQPMCDRYSQRYGYICYDCFALLTTAKCDIVKFMNMPTESDEELRAWGAYCDEIFKDRDSHSK